MRDYFINLESQTFHFVTLNNRQLHQNFQQDSVFRFTLIAPLPVFQWTERKIAFWIGGINIGNLFSVAICRQYRSLCVVKTWTPLESGTHTRCCLVKGKKTTKLYFEWNVEKVLFRFNFEAMERWFLNQNTFSWALDSGSNSHIKCGARIWNKKFSFIFVLDEYYG